MALTGLFLISFLIIHVGINSCIFNDLTIFNAKDNGSMFNRAAFFMGNSFVIRLIEIGLFAGFIVHIVQGYVLAAQNNAKRKVGYNVKMGTKGSNWYAKSMGLLGTLILIFLVVHISHFWVPSRVTTHSLDEVYYKGQTTPVHDLFQRMVNVFQEPWVIGLYLIGCISLAWHLLHGFQSAFRTLGLSNHKYIGMIKTAGVVFSIIVPLLFALMPVSMYLGWVGYEN